MKSISVEELKNINHSEIILIDVRTAAEFESGHIPFAVNMSLNAFDRKGAENLANGKKILLVCKSGTRSKQACEILEKSGLSEAITVSGGTDAWRNAGYPLAGSSSTLMSIERQVRIAAGILVLTGIILGTFVNAGFYFLSAFVGAGLIFAGITDWCGMGLLLMRMPWNCRSN